MKPQIKYGLMVAGTGILISLIIFLIGIDKTDTGQYLQWVNIIFLIMGMVMAIKAIRDTTGGGYITFGKAFSSAFLVSVISTLIVSIYTYFYMKFINPGLVDYLLEKQMQKMEERGMAGEQLEQAMDMTAKFMTPGIMMVFSLFFGILFGALIALVIAAIMKKVNPNPFVTSEQPAQS